VSSALPLAQACTKGWRWPGSAI